MLKKTMLAGAVFSALVGSSAVSAAEPGSGSSDSSIESLAPMIVIPVIIGNFQAAGRESGEGAKLIRAVTGISLGDIDKHGLWGGPNSFFRKPLGVH